MTVPDAQFSVPRLAEIYDVFDGERSDLDLYMVLVGEFGASTVLDLGCGTGTFACLLAQRGVDVVGVDPAPASVDLARRKLGGAQVRWIVGDATTLSPMQVDMVTMTANVAQVFLTDEDWVTTLRYACGALRPAGRLVFEVRDPTTEIWQTWTRANSYQRFDIPGMGAVESWRELTDVSLPLVSFRTTYAFASDGAVLTSDSTLRFRRQAEVVASLHACGFLVEEVRDAPDRPGLELVFVAAKCVD
jgi:SAM-dependent methyltransferase